MDNIGGFANYKGVMLCSRPEDKSNKVIERPFCSMVKHDNDLGVNPDKPQKRRVRKRKTILNLGVLQALVSHKKWLKSLKEEIRENKKIEATHELNEQLKRLKVKEESRQLREVIRNGETPEEFQLPKTGSLIGPTTNSQLDTGDLEKKKVTFRDSAADSVGEQKNQEKE